jgi:Holliday junction resolvase
MNSRAKGNRGERAWRDELRANGYDARRGQQFSGSPDSPDVICDALSWLHFEVKCVERLNIEDAMEQARRDSGLKTPIVAHKRNHRRWLVTLDAEDFFKFLRGDFHNEVPGELPSTAGETPALLTTNNNKPKQHQ